MRIDENVGRVSHAPSDAQSLADITSPAQPLAPIRTPPADAALAHALANRPVARIPHASSLNPATALSQVALAWPNVRLVVDVDPALRLVVQPELERLVGLLGSTFASVSIEETTPAPAGDAVTFVVSDMMQPSWSASGDIDAKLAKLGEGGPVALVPLLEPGYMHPHVPWDPRVIPPLENPAEPNRVARRAAQHESELDVDMGMPGHTQAQLTSATIVPLVDLRKEPEQRLEAWAGWALGKLETKALIRYRERPVGLEREPLSQRDLEAPGRRELSLMRYFGPGALELGRLLAGVDTIDAGTLQAVAGTVDATPHQVAAVFYSGLIARTKEGALEIPKAKRDWIAGTFSSHEQRALRALKRGEPTKLGRY